MENKLKKLYNYLVDNNYTEDASRIEVILDEYLQNNELSDLSKKDFQLCVIQDIWVISILKNYQIHISGGISLLK